MAANGAAEDDVDGRTSVSRRRFVVATGAGGVSVSLAGCADLIGGGGGGTEPDGTTGGTTTGSGRSGDATTVQWGFDPVAVQENGDAIKQALRDNGLPERVEVQFVPGDQDTGQRQSNYNRLLSAGEADPDMFLMDNGWVNVFIQRGQIQNLTELLSEDVVSTVNDEYFEGITSTARDPESDNLYGVPVFPDFPTMQYRRDLVEQAGYSPMENNWATEPMTWEKWSNVTADVTDNADVDFGFTTQWDIYEGTACCTFNETKATWGGAYFGSRENLFGPVGDRPITVDAQPLVHSLDMMRRFVHGEAFDHLSGYAGGFTPTDILGWKEEDSRAPFANGNAVMHRNWPYSLALTGRNPDETRDPALGDELGAMPMPYAVPESEAQAGGMGGSIAALGGWHMTVNPNSQQKDAVVEVVRAAMEPGFQLRLLEIQGWLPPRPELFNSSEAQNVPVVGEYLDTLRIAGERSLPRPVTPVWSDQSSVIAQQANRAVGQEVSSQQAMTSLKSSLQEIENGGSG